MKILKRFMFPAYLVITTMLGLLLIEWVALEINKHNGNPAPFLWNDNKSYTKRHSSDNFSLIDPHLGYARGLSERRVKDFIRKGYEWKDGFAIYKAPKSPYQRPIILTLGGSTTDAVQYGHSWPEELANILKGKQIAATVINGGVGGYSTSQELLKLIRDGVEFSPDIVISYSGVNDRGTYGKLPHPFVHRYQEELFRGIVDTRPTFMPNTIVLIDGSTDLIDGGVRGYTLGLATTKFYPEWYIRNITLMKAVSNVSGAQFFGVLQPNAYVGNFPWSTQFEAKKGKPKEYISALRSLYQGLQESPAYMSLVHDFTSIFDDYKDAYIEDGVHTTIAGEVIIATNIYKLIEPAVRVRSSDSR
ncbi:MAG: GDSL-type esterase/lipase family protein [Rhodomicrobiaceae bacterium]